MQRNPQINSRRGLQNPGSDLPKRNQSQGACRERRIVMEEIKREDLNCAVCYSLIAEPSITPCEHLFCLSCIEKCMNFKSKCALCRQPLNNYTPELDKNLQRHIAVKFSEEFEERKKELIKAGLWSSNRIGIVLEYGNDWEEIKRPQISKQGNEMSNRWTMYLRTPNDPKMIDKLVESITFTLHPTYASPVITVKKAPWMQSKIAYGWFDLTMRVKFQKWTKLDDLELIHTLEFTKKGKFEKSKVFITQDTFDEHQAHLSNKQKGRPNASNKFANNAYCHC